jgi:hypothetical protein
MLTVVAFAEGPLTKVMDGFEADRVDGCRDPYPPPSVAMVSTVVNAVDSVCCA